jgi:hypothetical protein
MRRSPGPRCERTTGASPPKVIAGITTGNHSIEGEDFRSGPAQQCHQTPGGDDVAMPSLASRTTG